MVGDWVNLFFIAISHFVGRLTAWEIMGVKVVAIISVTSVFIIVFRGFLYRIKG